MGLRLEGGGLHFMDQGGQGDEMDRGDKVGCCGEMTVVDGEVRCVRWTHATCVIQDRTGCCIAVWCSMVAVWSAVS